LFLPVGSQHTTAKITALRAWTPTIHAGDAMKKKEASDDNSMSHIRLN